MLRQQEAHQVRRVAVARDRPPGERYGGGVGDGDDDGDEDTAVAAGYTGARLRGLRRRRRHWRQEAAAAGVASADRPTRFEV